MKINVTPKKNKWEIPIIIGIIICLLLIFWLFYMLIFSKINKVSNEQVIAYLNEKYGEQGFYFVEDAACNLLNLGVCYKSFSSTKLNGKTFYVSWEDAKGKNMNDHYIEKIYEDELTNYYTKYFEGKFEFSFNVQAIVLDECKNCNEKFVVFEEYLELVKNNKLAVIIHAQDTLKGNKYFHLDTEDKNVDDDDLTNARIEVEKYIKNKYDFDDISNKINNIIYSNNLNYIYRVDFGLNDCSESEYLISCQYSRTLYSRY